MTIKHEFYEMKFLFSFYFLYGLLLTVLLDKVDTICRTLSGFTLKGKYMKQFIILLL